VRLQAQSRRIILEFAGPVAPEPVDFRGLPGSPKFPGNPHDHSPCSPTPAGPGTCYGTKGQRTRHGPRIEPKRGLLTISKFRGSITRLLVSLSTPRGGGFPPLHARLASGCWSQLCRPGFQPAGFLRKVSEHLGSSSFPELSWREVRSCAFLRLPVPFPESLGLPIPSVKVVPTPTSERFRKFRATFTSERILPVSQTTHRPRTAFPLWRHSGRHRSANCQRTFAASLHHDLTTGSPGFCERLWNLPLP